MAGPCPHDWLQREPSRAAWLTSVPGAHELRSDALVGSALPAQFTAMGCTVVKIGETQRILRHAIRQKIHGPSRWRT
jgi:hypothetical protein